MCTWKGAAVGLTDSRLFIGNDRYPKMIKYSFLSLTINLTIYTQVNDHSRRRGAFPSRYRPGVLAGMLVRVLMIISPLFIPFKTLSIQWFLVPDV